MAEDCCGVFLASHLRSVGNMPSARFTGDPRSRKIFRSEAGNDSESPPSPSVHVPALKGQSEPDICVYISL
jgi:hypothetical protein